MNGTRGQNTCDGEYNATQTSRRCLRCQSTTTTKVAKEKITTSEQDNVFFQTDWLSYSIATRKMFPLCVLLPFSSFNYFHVWVVAGCWDWVPHRVMRSRPRWFVHWTARQPVSLLPRRKSFHLFSIIIIIYHHFYVSNVETWNHAVVKRYKQFKEYTFVDKVPFISTNLIYHKEIIRSLSALSRSVAEFFYHLPRWCLKPYK